MFDSCLENLRQSISSRGGSLLDVPNEFAECSSNKGNGIIKSWLWDVPGFRRWRITSLDAGETLQVLNSVAYPDYSNDQPLLGVDLLWFGRSNKMVLVMDFQPLIQDKEYFDRYFLGLKSLKSLYPEMHNEKTMHFFDPHKYFSPWLLFYKGGVSSNQDFWNDPFNSFLDSYWNLSEDSNRKCSLLNSEKVRSLQIEYDKYSAENDPAHGLFSNYFGKDWSDRFLKEFLFPGDPITNRII